MGLAQGCQGPEVSFSLLDGAVSALTDEWKCSQARGTEKKNHKSCPASWSWEVGGNHYFCFSCWSKIMFCLGPEPYAPGRTTPHSLPALVLSTASPSARRFLPCEPRGRAPHKSFAASRSQFLPPPPTMILTQGLVVGSKLDLMRWLK